jgi:hypothetical protein
MSTLATLPPGLHSKIDALARRIRVLRALRGASLLLLVLLITGGAALLVDLGLGLPAWVRTVWLAVWLLAGVGVAAFGLILPLSRPLNPDALAALIEERYPDLGERLTSVVELAEARDPYHGAPALVTLLTEETEARTQRLSFRQAVPARSAARLTSLACVALLLAVPPSLLWPRHALELGRRFMLPWRTPGLIVLYSVEVAPGDVITAKGRPLAFHLVLHPENERVALPTACTLVVNQADGTAARLRMLAERPDAFALEMDKVPGDFSYYIEAGDAISPTYQVTAVEPVELAADSPQITVSPPAYARKSFEEQTIHGLADLAVLQHSRIRFEFRFTRPAVGAALEWLPQPTSKDTNAPRPTVRMLELASDRLTAVGELPALASGSYKLTLEAEHEIRTDLEPRVLTIKVDQPPVFLKALLGTSSSEGPQRGRPAADKEERKVVQPYDVVPVEVALADDIGVERADLEYRINDGKTQAETVALQGAGTREAAGRLVFRLAEKALKNGDTIYYRLKATDNRRVPEAKLEPQAVYYPADQRWLALLVARQAEPLKQQEIAAQREALDRRLEEIKRDLQKEQRAVYKLQQEARDQPALTAEQAKDLKQLHEDNRANADALRELAREAADLPNLQPLAEQARNVADREMERTAQALRAAEKKAESQQRDASLQKADRELSEALRKLEEMRRLNERLAQERSVEAKLDRLAAREQRLAERTAEQAARDPVRDPQAAQQTDQLQGEQKEVAKDLERLAEQSEPVRNALENARAEKARDLAQRARELAQTQRELADARRETQQQEKNAKLAELARKQEKLGQEAARLSRETRQAAQVAQTQPLKPDEAQKAARDLRQQKTEEAMRRQDQAGQELERLARELDRAQERSRDPREAARQLSRLQQGLRQRLQEETQKKDAKSPLSERLQTLRQEQEALERAAEQLPAAARNEAAQKDRREATQRAAQAAEALKNQDTRQAENRMAQASQALDRLAGQLPNQEQRQREIQKQLAAVPPRSAAAKADEPAKAPQGLPSREQARQARDLAQQQRELRDAVKRLTRNEAQADSVPHQNPVAQLAQQQEELARQAGELKQNVGREQGQQAPTTQQAQQAAQSARQAAQRMQAGALQRAQQAGRQTAQQLQQLSRDLAQAPRGQTDAKRADPAQQARQLAQRQEELNRRLEPLVGDREAQQAQQLAGQQELQRQTGDLNKDLGRLAEQMRRSPAAQHYARNAAELGRQAQLTMQKARDLGRLGNQDQATQARQHAAQNLDQAAGAAEDAAQQMAAVANAQSAQPANSQAGQQTGQALQQAQAAMNQAQGQLANGQNQAAQASMQQAAQGLQQAARQMAQKSGQPGPSLQPNPGREQEGGKPDPSILGAEAKKYAGKRWGELPGELRTKIVQDMQAKYGDDYARIIKLYFEQIADTKKP